MRWHLKSSSFLLPKWRQTQGRKEEEEGERKKFFSFFSLQPAQHFSVTGEQIEIRRGEGENEKEEANLMGTSCLGLSTLHGTALLVCN